MTEVYVTGPPLAGTLATGTSVRTGAGAAAGALARAASACAVTPAVGSFASEEMTAAATGADAAAAVAAAAASARRFSSIVTSHFFPADNRLGRSIDLSNCPGGG